MKWFHNLKIGLKLGIGFGLCLALMGVIALSALSSVSKLKNEIHALSDDALGGLTALTEFIDASKQARIVQFRVASTGGEKAVELAKDVQDNLDAADTGLKNYEKLIETDEDRQNYQKLQTAWDEYKSTWQTRKAEMLKAEGAAGFALMEKHMSGVFTGKVRPAIDAILQWNKKDSAQMVDKADNAAGTASKLVLSASSIAAIVGIVFALFMTRVIVKAIASVSTGMTSLSAKCVPQLTAGLGALAEGNLTVPAEFSTEPVLVDSKDELGLMGQNFNSMLAMVGEAIGSYNSARESLSSLVGTVADGSTSVASTSQSLASAAEESSAAASEIALGSQKLAGSASEAAAVMEQLSAHVQNVAQSSQSQSHMAKEVGQSMKQAASGIAEVAASAQQMDSLATQGDAAVKETVNAIERLKTKVEFSAQMVKQLDEHGQMIGQIVQSIEQIAEQTNLLALNAAIEAARAGEHGRGFAVVAEEVRKLAEQAASSTKQISTMIGSVTATVNETVLAIKETNQEVEAGTRQSEQAGQSLSQILDAARQVAARTEAVAALTQQAAASMESMAETANESLAMTQEMATGTERVVHSITNVAAISQESAAGAEQLNSSIEEVGAAATEMSQMSQELQSLISRFTVESDTKAQSNLRLAA
ncbi:MAG: hypothetical protein BGO01_01355 [Armatimonadetes bacterium 55-13]|nr:MCP four helix bundle domain-containing protein [Armatimonadota bacterium]OJU65597.1 MAG: hypothetical protein BGO01_01355 [Armatimonadetes bacterium 55-13]